MIHNLIEQSTENFPLNRNYIQLKLKADKLR